MHAGAASTRRVAASRSVPEMGDIGVIARIVLSQTGVLATLVVGVLVLAPAAMTCARRQQWPRTRIALAGLSGASLALVPATTLARGDVFVSRRPSCLIQPGLSLARRRRLSMLSCSPRLPSSRSSRYDGPCPSSCRSSR